MRVEVSKEIGGVRLLLRKPFLEPMNKGNMRRLAEEAKRRGGGATITRGSRGIVSRTGRGTCMSPASNGSSK